MPKYFDVNGNFVYVNNESAETRYGFEKAKDLMKLAITNNLTTNFVAPSGQPNGGVTFIPWSEIDHGGYDGNGINPIHHLTILTALMVLTSLTMALITAPMSKQQSQLSMKWLMKLC